MEFRDLKRQYIKLKTDIDNQIMEVISSACFISGPHIMELESRLAAYVGVKHCISCGNGTDAITIALLAYGIGSGDAVFVPDFTFFSTGESPAIVGATPIFVDVRKDTYNVDALKLEESIKKVIMEGQLNPRVVIAVDLFGLPADYDAICQVCEKYDLLLLEDGAQGFGGSIRGKKACSFGNVATTSFFPAKPLGCYGDGGAIFTNDDNIAACCRSIAVHGKNVDDKYDNVRVGMNSRLDTLQAAILLPKFQAFQEYELENVNRVAETYTKLLSAVDGLGLPVIADDFYSSWAQYTIQLPTEADRERVQAYMKTKGIPTMVYYVKPMHRQRAFAGTMSEVAECPVTKSLCENVLCLPIHPYLEDADIAYIVEGLKSALEIIA